MKSEFWRKNYYWIILAGIGIVAFGLRVWQMDRLDLWGDEIFTVFQAKKNIAGVIDIAIKDTALPLYPLILHFWIGLVGDSTNSVRFLSVLIDMAGLGAFYFLSRKLLGKWPGLAAIGLYAVNFIAIYYAREARTYGLLSLLSIFCAYATLRFLESSSRPGKQIWGGLLGLSLGLGLYTHNLAIFIIGSVFLYLGIDLLITWNKEISRSIVDQGAEQKTKFINTFSSLLKQPLRTKLIQVISLVIGTLILILPALYAILLQSQVVQKGGFWLKFDPIPTTALTLTDLTSGLHLMTWDFPNPFDLAVIILSLMLVLIASSYMILERNKSLEFRLPAIFFWASLAGMFILSFKSPVMYVRYISYLNPFFILLILQGILILPIKRVWQGGLIGLMVMLQLQTYFGHYLIDYTSKPSYSKAVATIQSNYQTEDGILLSDMSPFYGFKYYAASGWEIKIYDPYEETPYYYGISQTSEQDFSRERDGFENKQRIWWIQQSKKQTPDFLNQNYTKSKDETIPGNLDVQLWVRK